MGLALVVAFSACGAGEVAPSPSPSPTPAFDSDEDAVAAAVAAYERYLVVNAEINADHGADAERILEVTTNHYGTELLADYREMRQAGIHITGAAVLRSWHPIEIDPDRGTMLLGMCVDVGPTRYIDQDGEDVTPEGKDLAPLAVTFTVRKSAAVVLDGSEQWSGETPC